MLRRLWHWLCDSRVDAVSESTLTRLRLLDLGEVERVWPRIPKGRSAHRAYWWPWGGGRGRGRGHRHGG